MKHSTLALLNTSFILSAALLCSCGADYSDHELNDSGISYTDVAYYSEMSTSNVDDTEPDSTQSEVSKDFEPASFTNPLNAPFSTFAADIDTASYTLFRYKITNQISPFIDVDDKSSIPYRTEEMINYFKYDYPAPSGDDVFTITTEYSPCPWNKDTQLLLIGAQAKKIESIPDSNYVFLIDVSGSMSAPSALPLLKESIIQFLPTLTERDKISIVTYADGNDVILAGANPVTDRDEIIKAINDLKASGSTNGEGGMKLAYKAAKDYYIEGGNNRIIMGSDGDLNVGISTTEAIKDFVAEKRKEGIYLTILGFGYGNLRDDMLETIADNGNGSYHYIDSTLEAERVLVEERDSTMFVAAKDVKFQMSFNPDKVKGYRLIGYENRVMPDQDFKDDTKDGGEVGSNHQVTILYEIAETGSPVAIDAFNEVNAPESMPVFENGEMASLALRYKAPSGSEESVEHNYPIDLTPSAMGSNITFAAAVAELSMILNNSKFAGSSNYTQILELLAVLPEAFYDKYKKEFVELVKSTQSFAKEN